MTTATPRRSILGTAGVLALLGLSACAQPTPGTASPVPTSTSASKPTQKIKNPKNLKAVDDVCSLLTPQQVAELGGGGKPDREMTMYGEPKCTWSNDNFAMTIALNTTTGTGAEEITKIDQSTGQGIPEVKGYPAAHIDKTTILCRVEVAVAREQSFAVNYALYSGDAPAMQKPCQYAEKIAAGVLENIPDA